MWTTGQPLEWFFLHYFSHCNPLPSLELSGITKLECPTLHLEWREGHKTLSPSDLVSSPLRLSHFVTTLSSFCFPIPSAQSSCGTQRPPLHLYLRDTFLSTLTNRDPWPHPWSLSTTPHQFIPLQSRHDLTSLTPVCAELLTTCLLSLELSLLAGREPFFPGPSLSTVTHTLSGTVSTLRKHWPGEQLDSFQVPDRFSFQPASFLNPLVTSPTSS